MREIMKIDSVPKAMAFLTALVSLVLLGYGFFGASYWSGFGLVLLMPALLAMVSFSEPAHRVSRATVHEISRDSGKAPTLISKLG